MIFALDRTVFERHPAFHFDDLSLPLLYLLMLLSATVRTFGWAARSSFFPTLVPRENFRQCRDLEQQHLSDRFCARPGDRRISHREAGFPLHLRARRGLRALLFPSRPADSKESVSAARGHGTRGAAWRREFVLF